MYLAQSVGDRSMVGTANRNVEIEETVEEEKFIQVDGPFSMLEMIPLWQIWVW